MLSLPIPRRTVAVPSVTVSSSFNRFLRETRYAIEELQDEGARVLSPRGVVEYKAIQGGFLLLEGDRPYWNLSIKSVQDRHHACIAQSDFLLVVCPGGYIGVSVALEMGVAYGANVPIYATHMPYDEKIAAFVHVIPSIKLAVMNHRLVKL